MSEGGITCGVFSAAVSVGLFVLLLVGYVMQFTDVHSQFDKTAKASHIAVFMMVHSFGEPL